MSLLCKPVRAICIAARKISGQAVKSHSLRWTFKGPAIGRSDASGALRPLGGEPQWSGLAPGRHQVWATQSCSTFHFVNTSTYLLVPLLTLSCYSRGMTLAHTLHRMPGSGHRGACQNGHLATLAPTSGAHLPFPEVGVPGKATLHFFP